SPPVKVNSVCGIVADSQEEAEYQETFDKVNKILRQLEK
ncbi:hypothetical protein ACUOCP_23500, partial [Escherichia sp. R-CC3]